MADESSRNLDRELSLANVKRDRSGAIADQFQRVLGRAPREDELNYFYRFLFEESLSPNEIGQILESSPEYQTKLQQGQQAQQLQEFQGLLGAGDRQVLGQAQDLLTGQFAKMGRSGSSGYVSAFANAARDLALQRQNQLAGFYASTVPGRQAALSNLAIGQGQQAFGGALNTRAYNIGRENELSDFYRAQDQYNDALNQHRRGSRAGAIGRAVGGLAGAGIGSFFPGGTQIGAQLGSQLGGLAGY